jgi:DNA invertase Pin-like site-specific DNA recombinase
MKIVHAYSYIRFSTPEQAKGDSLRRQVKLAEDYCKKRGWTLDNSLRLFDRGVSAYKGRNKTHGALAGFLAEVEAKRVPRGSVLIVESLDRLSRQEIDNADQLVTGILRAGVSIVTLRPERELKPDAVNDLLARIELLVLASRANEESAMKSHRGKEAWATMRATARETKKAITPSYPGWLRRVDDKWQTIPERVEIIQRIVRMALDGYGTYTIMKKLNGESVPSFRRSKPWSQPVIAALLRSPTLIGEYQPHIMVDGKKQPVGERFAYYPAVINKKEFYRLQSLLDSHSIQRGRNGAHVTNLFKGLLFDADNHSMVIVDKGPKSHHYLVSSAARLGLHGSKYISFRYDLFEAYMLRELNDLKPADILPAVVEDTEDEVSRIDGEIADIDDRIAITHQRLTTDKEFATLLDVLKALEQRRTQLVAQREAVRTHPSASKVLGETQSITAQLATATDKIDVRTRLRAAIRRLVSLIRCYPCVATLNGVEWRFLFTTITFRSGGIQRIHIGIDREGNEQFQVWQKGENDDPRQFGISILDKITNGETTTAVVPVRFTST